MKEARETPRETSRQVGRLRDLLKRAVTREKAPPELKSAIVRKIREQ